MNSSSESSVFYEIFENENPYKKGPTRAVRMRLAKFMADFDVRINDLRQSKFYRLEFLPKLIKCLDSLHGRSIEKIVCYGLGSFYSAMNETSKNQLALLHLMHQHFAERYDNFLPLIKIYDPEFTPNDRRILKSFKTPQYDVMDTDEHCAHKINTIDRDQCVFFYMPHLYKSHFENLIGTNWSPEGLASMFIYGNSFNAMLDSLSTYEYRVKVLSYIKRVVTKFKPEPITDNQPVIGTNAWKKVKKVRKKKVNLIEVKQVIEDEGPLVEITIDPEVVGKNHPEGFNDMSFHYFRSDWLLSNRFVIEENKFPNWQVDKRMV